MHFFDLLLVIQVFEVERRVSHRSAATRTGAHPFPNRYLRPYAKVTAVKKAETAAAVIFERNDCLSRRATNTGCRPVHMDDRAC